MFTGREGQRTRKSEEKRATISKGGHQIWLIYRHTSSPLLHVAPSVQRVEDSARARETSFDGYQSQLGSYHHLTTTFREGNETERAMKIDLEIKLCLTAQTLGGAGIVSKYTFPGVLLYGWNDKQSEAGE